MFCGCRVFSLSLSLSLSLYSRETRQPWYDDRYAKIKFNIILLFLLFLDRGSRLISRQPQRKWRAAKYPRLYGPIFKSIKNVQKITKNKMYYFGKIKQAKNIGVSRNCMSRKRKKNFFWLNIMSIKCLQKFSKIFFFTFPSVPKS